MGRLGSAIGMVMADAVVSGVTLYGDFNWCATAVLGTISVCGMLYAANQVADGILKLTDISEK